MDTGPPLTPQGEQAVAALVTAQTAGTHQRIRRIRQTAFPHERLQPAGDQRDIRGSGAAHPARRHRRRRLHPLQDMDPLTRAGRGLHRLQSAPGVPEGAGNRNRPENRGQLVIGSGDIPGQEGDRFQGHARQAQLPGRRAERASDDVAVPLDRREIESGRGGRHRGCGHAQGQVVLGFAPQQPGLGAVEEGLRTRVADDPQIARGRAAVGLSIRPNLPPRSGS